MSDLCVVGSVNIDLTFHTTRLPLPGETLTGRSFHFGFGGKGGNQAVQAARLGARVKLVACIGRDAFVEQTLKHYREEGIDTSHLRIDEAGHSGVAAIVVDDSAQNCILVVPGANAALSTADVRRAAEAIASSALLLCQLEVPIETTLHAFRVARAAGVRTVLNPAPAAAVPDELLRLTDLCIPNETEMHILSGRPVTTLEEAEAAAQVLRTRGPGTVIVTLGSRGALLVNATTTLHVAPPRVNAVDTSGAGDSFIGALAASWAERLSLEEAMRRASMIAALSVTRVGTQSAFPRKAEVDRFAHQERD